MVRLLLLTGLTLVITTSLGAETFRDFVPVVGHIVGGGDVLWVTDVALANRSGKEQTVALAMSTNGEPFFVTTLAPGEEALLLELVGSVFGIPGAIGLMEINTLGEEPVMSQVVIRGVSEHGTSSQVVPRYGVSTGPATEILSGLVSNDDYRTNIGVANAGSIPVVVTLSLRRTGGRSFAVTTVVLSPGEHVQRAIVSFFPVLAASESLEIVAEPSGPGAVVYASVLSNETHEPRFVAAQFQ